MEAGHHMHQYSVELFTQLDQGKPIDNLYLLNGHFLDTLKPLFSNPSLDQRFRVTFSKDFNHNNLDTLSALDHVNIEFLCEWPLEIILDHDTILNKYNAVLKFLMKIKRVNYVLGLRDYWQTKRLRELRKRPKKGEHMGVKEQIMQKNR